MSEGVPIGHTSEAWVGWVVRQTKVFFEYPTKKLYRVAYKHTEDLNLIYNKKGIDIRWLARPFPSGGYPAPSE
jgi:hypothetical protein